MLHSTTVPGNLHPAHNWAVADSTARLALSIDAADLGKLCWQQDDNSLHILTATTPTWAQVGGASGSFAPLVHTHSLTAVTQSGATTGQVPSWSGSAWVPASLPAATNYPAQNNTWTKAQRGAYVALTSSAASIVVDAALSNNFNHTLTENTTLAAPTNVVAGQSGVIHFTQHASAAKTLAFNTFWQFGLDATHVLTTTLNGTAVMSYIIDPAGTSATCSWVNKS